MGSLEGRTAISGGGGREREKNAPEEANIFEHRRGGRAREGEKCARGGECYSNTGQPDWHMEMERERDNRRGGEGGGEGEGERGRNIHERRSFIRGQVSEIEK